MEGKVRVLCNLDFPDFAPIDLPRVIGGVRLSLWSFEMRVPVVVSVLLLREAPSFLQVCPHTGAEASEPALIPAHLLPPPARPHLPLLLVRPRVGR